MRIEAKVNDQWRFQTLTCFGYGFNKVDWLPVPVGGEEEVKANPFLDSRPLLVEPEEKVIEHAPLVSPHAKKMASVLKININEVEGTGKDGMITKQDVENYAASLETTEEPEEGEPEPEE